MPDGNRKGRSICGKGSVGSKVKEKRCSFGKGLSAEKGKGVCRGSKG